jgi:hypothetical protein
VEQATSEVIQRYSLMTSTLPPDEDAPLISARRRERFFFGVGLVILPPFWSWWTLQRGFTDRQRLAAFAWSTIYLIALLTTWDRMQDRYVAAAIHYPFICLWLSICLFAWLNFRMGGTVVDLLMIVCVFGPYVRYIVLESPPAWCTLAWLGVLCLLHLALDPSRRAKQRFKDWSAPWLARHHMRW